MLAGNTFWSPRNSFDLWLFFTFCVRQIYIFSVVVLQVVYNIAYGGTSGITNASVEFIYANLTILPLPLQQTFQANFYQVSTVQHWSNSFSFVVSHHSSISTRSLDTVW